MDHRARLLVNPYEEAVDAQLRKAVERYGGKINVKTRIADALRIEKGSLSHLEYAYALKAHFDFIVMQAATTQALFAVEFDGLLHETDDVTIRRDRLKNSICSKLGMPLLRVGADYLQHVGRFTIVSWLAELWFVYEGWQQAQERGGIPADEPFLYFLAQDFDPFIRYRAHVKQLFDANQCAVPVPRISHVEKADGRVEATAQVPMNNGRIYVGKAHCQSITFPFVPSVGAHEITEELAIVAAVKKMPGWRNSSPGHQNSH